jgi:hypothetical protein
MKKYENNYQVKTPRGYIALTLNYQDACNLAFMLNKHHGAIDYAVIVERQK